MNMSFFRVILERILFVVLISLLYMFFLTEDIRSLKDFNNNKHVVFEDITYSNGILDIKNSPTLFKSNNFTLIGDTREDFETLRNRVITSNGTPKSALKDEGVTYSTYNYWLRKSRAAQEPHPIAPITIRETQGSVAEKGGQPMQLDYHSRTLFICKH